VSGLGCGVWTVDSVVYCMDYGCTDGSDQRGWIVGGGRREHGCCLHAATRTNSTLCFRIKLICLLYDLFVFNLKILRLYSSKSK